MEIVIPWLLRSLGDSLNKVTHSMGRPRMKQISKSDKRKAKRFALLADVATMYFVDQMTQGAIAKVIGTTPSNVSRMISDCQRLGVVKITIERPLLQDEELERELAEKFGLKEARVVIADDTEEHDVLQPVATAGAALFADLLFPECTIGITWGRTLQAVIQKIGADLRIGGEVVQLAGSVGATQHEYDAVFLVQELSKKLNSRALHLNAPFIVDSEEIAKSLLRNASNAATWQRAAACDIVIVGIGNVDPNHATLFSSGHLSSGEIGRITREKAVGEICGHPIDEEGRPVSEAFSSRVISVRPETLRKIPTRIAVGARRNSSRPILAALRGGYVTHLAVDAITANFLVGAD